MEVLHAIKFGREDTVRRKIAEGMNVNAKYGATHQRPLHLAWQGGIAKLLLDAGADVNGTDKFKNTSLHMVEFSADNDPNDGLKFAKVLIEANANVNALNRKKRTPLHLAKTEEIATLLLKNLADPNAKEEDGMTPLHLVLNKGVATALLLAGSDPNVVAQDPLGSTPLHCARTEGIARVLIEAGADVNGQRDQLDGVPPLLMGAGKLDDSDGSGGFIFGVGGGDHAENSDGSGEFFIADMSNVTPLYTARTAGIARALLEAGADPEGVENPCVADALQAFAVKEALIDRGYDELLVRTLIEFCIDWDFQYYHDDDSSS